MRECVRPRQRFETMAHRQQAVRDQFRYAQGQHLTLRAHIAGQDVRRSYSICSGVQAEKFRRTVFRAPPVTLNALPAMAPRQRRYGLAAVGVAAVGTLVPFVNYALTNVAQPSTSLVVTFGAGAIVAFVMLALITLAGFRAK